MRQLIQFQSSSEVNQFICIVIVLSYIELGADDACKHRQVLRGQN